MRAGFAPECARTGRDEQSKCELPGILLVEDNEEYVELLRARFRLARLMNPLRAMPDGIAAARYLAGRPPYEDRRLFPLPGIVLLDLVLPRMDGFEVLAWIRSREEFNRMPVIVLTEHEDDPLYERARECGADGYLLKGSDIDGLIHLLRNAFLGWAHMPRDEASPRHTPSKNG